MNRHGSFDLFTSDSVFEEEGIETPCPEAQLAADVNKPNPAEAGGDDGDRGETGVHSGTGEVTCSPIPSFISSFFFLCLLSRCGLIRVRVLDFLNFFSW